LLTGALIAVGSNSDNPESVQVAADVGGMAATAGLMAYSRTFERQADNLGQTYMAKLGYPPLEAAHAMQSMMVKEEYDTALNTLTNEGKLAKEGMLSGLYADHPATPERQRRLAQTTLQPLTTTEPSANKLDPVGHARYLEALDGTAYGPKPKYGIAGRGILALPMQRIALALPDGFAMDYIHHENPDKVGAWKGGHMPSLVQLRVTVKPLRLGLSPASLLQNGLSFRGRNVTTFRLNDGTLAATMLRKPLLSSQTTRYFAIASPNPKRNEAVLVMFTYLTDADMQTEDPTIMAIFKNSHLMTIEGAKKAEPVKVRIFRAEKGDTVTKRASYLPTGALKPELFRALNGIPSNTEVLSPGVLYKTLSDPVIPE
jgi:predicted Zn-dependent protease